MIITLMNQKRGHSKLTDDGYPWTPNNLLQPKAKEKQQLIPGRPSNRQEAPAPTS